MKHQFGELRIYHEIAGIAHDPVIAVTAVIARDLVIGKAKTHHGDREKIGPDHRAIAINAIIAKSAKSEKRKISRGAWANEFSRARCDNFAIHKNWLAAEEGLADYSLKSFADVRTHLVALEEAAFIQGIRGCKIDQSEISVVADNDATLLRQAEAAGRKS